VKTLALRISLVGGLLCNLTSRAADVLMVVNKSDDTVSFLDAKTGAQRGSVAVGKGPHEVELLADGRTAAVSNYGTQAEPGSSLSLIAVDTRAAKPSIDLGHGTRPHGLRSLKDGRLLVTAEGTQELLIVDPGVGRVIDRIPTNRETSHMVAAAPDGTRAYVANIGSGSLTAVDLVGKKVLRDVPTGKGAEGIDISPSGREVWVTNRGSDTVSIIDAKSLETTATLKAAEFPIRIKFTPDGKRALVSCARSGDVLVFDVGARKELLRIPLGLRAVPGSEQHLFATRFGKSPAPVGLLIAPDGKRAWVASTNADVVSEIDLLQSKTTRLLAAGREPDGLAGAFEQSRR